MKTLRLAGITLLAFLTICFVSCNKDNNGNNTNDEIIEYQGEYPAPKNIEYVEDGVTYEIEAIPGQVVISTAVDYNTVVNAVNSNGGSIIEQYPPFGHYLVEVTIGRELTFISAMNELNISADLNTIEYAKEKFDYYVFDDYNDVNGVQHGKKISNTLTSCQNASVINEINVFYRVFLPLNISNYKFGWTLSKGNEQKQILVNWSHGYGKNSDDWSIMSETERKDFIKGWEKHIKHTLDRIILLKTKRPDIDIVFAQAAGNERCPLTTIINSLKLDPKYKTILEENVIIVSDHSYYANTSSTYGDFCYIKEHPYYNPNGGTTSLATPQALCYINQVIKGTVGEDGKNITAVQALAAVKAAIRQNSNGELDLDEALEMARMMYSTMSHEIIVTPNELTFEAISGGYQVINVVVNSVNPMQWTATCNESWVHLSVTSGTNDTNVQVSVDNNTSPIARTAMIIFTTETGTAGVVAINQAERSDWVDLGLPSGLLWATRNVGANSPWDDGSYFAWSEAQPKSVYSTTFLYGYWMMDYPYWHLTKYNTKSDYGPVDNLTILQSGDDAATANYGGRMPTKEEWEELLNTCTKAWIRQNGVNRLLLTGPNGNTLSLPGAGYRRGSELHDWGLFYYWSGSLYTDRPSCAWGVRYSGNTYILRDDERWYGQSVRAVREN